MAAPFVDTARITVKAGSGGNGAVASHGEKYVAAGGPDRGDNVGKGSDDSLFALESGKVKFGRLGKDRKQVSIVEIAQ